MGGTRKLAANSCVPCRGDRPPLRGDATRELLAELGPGWAVVGDHHLTRQYRFANFREALEFTKRVGEIAESESHHPDLELAWGRVRVTIWTHKIDGLTESDFYFAAKTEEAFGAKPPGA